MLFSFEDLSCQSKGQSPETLIPLLTLDFL
jgi:hypothetical protein